MRCEICDKEETKYKCPKCLVQTCSLVCVKQHKVDSSCDGLRDKTKYVAVKDFDNAVLLSDYRFLEDASRKSDNAYRDHLKQRKWHPNHLNRLVVDARRKGVNLKLLPNGLTKRKLNSTFLHFKKKMIFWNVEWIFVDAAFTFRSRRVPENESLNIHFQTVLHHPGHDNSKQQLLAKYIDNNKLYTCIKKEGQPANNPRYIEVDLQNSLQQILKGQTIVENPTIYVVLNENANRFKQDTANEMISNHSIKLEPCIVSETVEGHEDNVTEITPDSSLTLNQVETETNIVESGIKDHAS